MRLTVFGLGEAGSLIAADLAAAGATVHGYDPADVATPAGVERAADPITAAKGSTMVLAITAAVDAQKAIAQAWGDMRRGTVYADLSTAPPGFKEDLADTAALRGLPFADVALMGPVPGNGLATPALASGPGAQRYAEVINGLGGAVEVIGPHPGEAAARKLLRSIITKGLTSLMIESLGAAERHGSADWLWPHLVDQLSSIEEPFLRRLLDGTRRHLDRRIIEMESAEMFMRSLDLEPIMTTATADVLRRIREVGTPEAAGVEEE